MQIILMAVIGILGGSQAWSFYKNYVKVKFAERKEKLKMEQEDKKNAHSFSSAERNEIKDMLSSQVEEYKKELTETKKELTGANSRITELEVKYATIRERLLRYTLHTRGKKEREKNSDGGYDDHDHDHEDFDH